MAVVAMYPFAFLLEASRNRTEPETNSNIVGANHVKTLHFYVLDLFRENGAFESQILLTADAGNLLIVGFIGSCGF